MAKQYSKAAAGTFKLNKGEAIHRWYSYLEGYSSCLINDIIEEIGVDKINCIYDPFCGTGTTSLVASSYGIKSYYSETNPFMQTVIEAKVNRVKRLRESGIGSTYLNQLLSTIKNMNTKIHLEPAEWDGFEKFYEPEAIYLLKDLLEEVNDVPEEDSIIMR